MLWILVALAGEGFERHSVSYGCDRVGTGGDDERGRGDVGRVGTRKGGHRAVGNGDGDGCFFAWKSRAGSPLDLGRSRKKEYVPLIKRNEAHR